MSCLPQIPHDRSPLLLRGAVQRAVCPGRNARLEIARQAPPRNRHTRAAADWVDGAGTGPSYNSSWIAAPPRSERNRERVRCPATSIVVHQIDEANRHQGDEPAPDEHSVD